MSTHRLYHQSDYYSFTHYLEADAIISTHEMHLKEISARTSGLSALKFAFELPESQVKVATGKMSQDKFDKRFKVLLSNMKRNSMNADLSHALYEAEELKRTGDLVMLGLDVTDDIPDQWQVYVQQVGLEHLIGIWTSPEMRDYVMNDLVCRQGGKYSKIPVFDVPE